ncbi:hypothetical protein [Nostoc sp. UIC 10630]|nr:hypothetical protein [Nostoc sp. UIC 10630]NEU81377.1 hypothetical protein [Nostoc sp. UIC 10630]
MKMLGFVPQTPLASPLALASPFGKRETLREQVGKPQKRSGSPTYTT